MHRTVINQPASCRAPRRVGGALALLVGALVATGALAQPHPVTPSQRSTAQQVAQQGVPLSELAPNAPEVYVVQRGDTLWGISGLYLQRPWRWPELWGMNLQSIANPHLIFPGQTLYLDKQGGFARLRTSPPGTDTPETVRISPRTRSAALSEQALPTLKPHLIEPFLEEPLVVDAGALQQAPRIVAMADERVLMAAGDRAYVRSDPANPLTLEPGEPRLYRVFRDAVALKDPATGEILGYEAQYLGKAELVRGEGFEDTVGRNGQRASEYVPATVVLRDTKEEIRAGDRLLPVPGRSFINFTPRAPQADTEARVVSLYGRSSVSFAAQNQVVAISLGTQDGIEPGHVMNLLTRGERIKDPASRSTLKLPSESNGTVMVFRTFDRVSYALILDIRSTGVRVGDRLVAPE